MSIENSHKIICASVLRQQPNTGILESLLMKLKNLNYGTYLVLCLHNKIPILEWYRNSRKAQSHEPNCLRDLIDSKAVAIDFNTFAIFFDDKLDLQEPLKFMAENQKQRDNWISCINSVRVDFRSLAADGPTTSTVNSDLGEENMYCRFVPTPIQSASPSPDNLEQEVSLPIDYTSGSRHSTSVKCEDKSPATTKSSLSPTPFVLNRESGVGLSTSNSADSSFRLSKESAPSVASSPSFSSSIASPLSQSRARSSTMTHFQFPASQPDFDRTSTSVLRNSSSSKENQTPGSLTIKRVSARKSCLNAPINGTLPRSSDTRLDKPVSPTTVVTRCDSKRSSVEQDENDADEVQDQVYSDGYYHCRNVSNASDYYRLPISPEAGVKPLKEPQRISLSKSICTENMKIVRMDSRFWVVGWEERCHNALSKSLHFGDEILEVNGNSVNSITDINTLFYNSPVGIPIQLLIRSYPYGQLKTLKKSVRISQKIGIVLHEGRNKIASIEPGTLASGKLPTEIVSFLDPSQKVMPAITEINNKALNPFASNEQPYERIGEIPNGQQFDVIIHPSDFVHLLKVEMKNVGYV